MSQPPPSNWPATPPAGPPGLPPSHGSAPPPAQDATGAGGEGTTAIHDTGYQHYHGPRGGLLASMRPVVVLSAQRVLGLRRPARAKIIPVATAFFAYVPAIVFVGMAVLIPDELRAEVMNDDARLYADYYGSIVAALVLFTAFSAPDILCPDRRTGMLGLYLASPLDRDHYLAAKAMAVGLVLAIVTVGPPLFLLVAYLIAGTGPDTPVDAAVLVVRVLIAGVAVSALYAAAQHGRSQPHHPPRRRLGRNRGHAPRFVVRIRGARREREQRSLRPAQRVGASPRRGLRDLRGVDNRD